MLKRIMRKQTTYLVTLLFCLIVISLGLSGCSLTERQQNEQLIETANVPTAAEYTFVASESGQTALDLLTTQAQVQSKTYGFGTFIEGINGVLGNNEQYWAFYVNDQYANEAADKIILKPGDRVSFRLQTVEVFPTEMSSE